MKTRTNESPIVRKAASRKAPLRAVLLTKEGGLKKSGCAPYEWSSRGMVAPASNSGARRS
jgi:hypothetical protein